MAMRSLMVVLLVIASPAMAGAASPSQPASWDVGLTLGGPTGVSARRWLGGPTPLTLASARDRVSASTATPCSAWLDLYLGGGALVAIGRGFCGYYRKGDYCEGDLLVGGRVPLGLDVRLRKAPVSLGVEVAFGPERFKGLLDAFLFVRFVVGP